jgi:hypothetical protein
MPHLVEHSTRARVRDPKPARGLREVEYGGLLPPLLLEEGVVDEGYSYRT